MTAVVLQETNWRTKMDGLSDKETMDKVAWEMMHAVETQASAEFAWSYWTDVRNWDDPPAKFELDGAFAEGARGTTRIPAQPPIAWFIRDVTPGAAATIEIPVDGATVSFAWRFAGTGDGRTRITQRVALHGEKAYAYIEPAKALTGRLPDGMRKLAAAIGTAAAKARSNAG
jgi:hypothetical protein